MANLSDNFPGADADPIPSPWLGHTGGFSTDGVQACQLISHAIVASSLIASAVSWRTDSQNDYSQVTYKNIDTLVDNDSGPAIHCNSSTPNRTYCYASLFLNGSFYSAYIGRYISGVSTDIFYDGSDIGFVPAAGGKLRIRHVSTTLYVDYNGGSGWINLGSGTDAVSTGGFDGAKFGSNGTNNDSTAFSLWANNDVQIDDTLFAQSCM